MSLIALLQQPYLPTQENWYSTAGNSRIWAQVVAKSHSNLIKLNFQKINSKMTSKGIKLGRRWEKNDLMIERLVLIRFLTEPLVLSCLSCKPTQNRDLQ
ncbi:hypothetical protein HZS_659 [Henneguya salminicola]|nr:hypothetical protein HZS_659 [Henneguya salminicola]